MELPLFLELDAYPPNKMTHATCLPDDLDQAIRLINEGWRANFGPGSVTRMSDRRSGVVDGKVWHALKQLQIELGWGPPEHK